MRIRTSIVAISSARLSNPAKHILEIILPAKACSDPSRDTTLFNFNHYSFCPKEPSLCHFGGIVETAKFTGKNAVRYLVPSLRAQLNSPRKLRTDLNTVTVFNNARQLICKTYIQMYKQIV
jgi:hypothetical protein